MFYHISGTGRETLYPGGNSIHNNEEELVGIKLKQCRQTMEDAAMSSIQTGIDSN